MPSLFTTSVFARAALILAALGLSASLLGGAVAAPPPTLGVGTPGAPGAGDPYFPNYGNGGYDARHYTIRVRYGVRSEKLSGETTIAARAAQDLSRFNLDLGLPADRVLVDGAPATFTQGRHELVVTPAAPIATGVEFTVKVRYAGKPGQLAQPGIGTWFETPDGAIAAGEPEIAALWFPSNDHPSDKATFDIHVQTNLGSQVVSNGSLVGRKKVGDEVRWHWSVSDPMTTYLATAVIGDYDLVKGKTPAGTPFIYGITQHMKGSLRRNAVGSLKITPRVTDYYARQFGEYPFENTGGTLVNASFGFALENQTRPNYSKVFFGGGPNHEVIAHELAHMWWGDSVSVRQWRHIWLNEGFATWSSWLYLAHEPSADFTVNDIFTANYRALRADTQFWGVAISDPGADRLFDFAVYYRGAMALQALRNRIGAVDHRSLLRQWAADHRSSDGTIEEFIALAETTSGEDLAVFFDEWLNQTNRPRPSVELGFPPSLLGKAPAKPIPSGLLPHERQTLH